MDIKDILALCQAGFRKEEILALASQIPSDSGEDAPSAPVSINSAAHANVAAPPESETPPAAPPNPMETVLCEIRNLGSRLSNMAVNNSEMPAPMTADDIIAHILSAPSKEGTNGK